MEPVSFVSADFGVPSGLSTELFVLEPLGARHNESDLAAWSSSIEHIQATPGLVGWGWPTRVYTLAENESDLVRHAADFAERKGFTYTVLDPATREVIGCLYLYPSRRDGFDVHARSWVRADRASLDKSLYDAVTRWLAESWPFRNPEYAQR
ncbi:MAG TPA: N-acetyltransferase [Trebonia sp.]